MEANAAGLAEARRKIDALDLNSVVARMMYVHYWPKKNAEATCAQYRNYLYLCKKYMGEHDLPPSYEIDEFWHNHILCTRKYHSEINDIFGCYLHHDPHHGDNGNISHADLLKTYENETQRLYNIEFGDYLHRTKPSLLGKFLMHIRCKIKSLYK